MESSFVDRIERAKGYNALIEEQGLKDNFSFRKQLGFSLPPLTMDHWWLSRKYLQATVQKPNLVCGRLILSYYIPSVDSLNLLSLSLPCLALLLLSSLLLLLLRSPVSFSLFHTDCEQSVSTIPSKSFDASGAIVFQIDRILLLFNLFFSSLHSDVGYFSSRSTPLILIKNLIVLFFHQSLSSSNIRFNNFSKRIIQGEI